MQAIKRPNRKPKIDKKPLFDEGDEIDAFPVFVSIDHAITQCSCCGKRKLKRTLKLSSPDIDQLNLGVVCAGKWFEINLYGNPFYAAKRLEDYLRTLSTPKLENIISDIREASVDWQ